MVGTIKKRPSQGKDPHDGGGIIGRHKYPSLPKWPTFPGPRSFKKPGGTNGKIV